MGVKTMSETIAMICENCGGNIIYNSRNGKYVCDSCDTAYVLTRDTDFIIVADKLMEYRGRSSYVVVPEGVRKIDTNAFNGLGIIEITLPSTLECINMDLFENCPDIRKVVLTEGIKKISGKGVDGLVYNVHNCRIEEMEIPESVEEIIGNPFHELGIRKIIIHRDIRDYFYILDYKPLDLSKKFEGYEISKYPWYCNCLETVVTPNNVIDYKKYKNEALERYELAKEEAMSRYEKEKNIIEEEKRRKKRRT